MADAKHGQTTAATAAEHGGPAAAELTDMEERTPFKELLSDQKNIVIVIISNQSPILIIIVIIINHPHP